MFSNNWNIKYVPKKSEKIIGNKENIAKIREWLQNYKNNINNGLFISGPHNTGKSMIVNILANELNYDILEFNTLNLKSSKNFLERIITSTNYVNINDYMSNKKKIVIIVDEIDGIINTSKNLITEIINYIQNKSNKFIISYPIICISCKNNSSTSIKKLSNLCDNIIFKKPSNNDLHILLERICVNEDIILDVDSKNLIVSHSNKNYKIIYLILENLKNYYKTKYINIDNVKKTIEIFSKPDIDISIYKSIGEIFNNNIALNDISRYYDVDKSYIPLYIHTNYNKYLHYKSKDTIINKLDKLDYYYDNLIDSCIINVKQEINNWDLDCYVGILSCYPSNYTLNNNIKKCNPNKNITIENSPIYSKLNYQYYNLKIINQIVKKINIGYNNFQEYTFKIYKYFIFKIPDSEEYSYFLRYLKQSDLSYSEFDKSIKLSYLYDSHKKIYTNRKKTQIEKIYNKFII